MDPTPAGVWSGCAFPVPETGETVLLNTACRLRTNTPAHALPPPELDLGLQMIESQAFAVARAGVSADTVHFDMVLCFGAVSVMSIWRERDWVVGSWMAMMACIVVCLLGYEFMSVLLLLGPNCIMFQQGERPSEHLNPTWRVESLHAVRLQPVWIEMFTPTSNALASAHAPGMITQIIHAFWHCISSCGSSHLCTLTQSLHLSPYLCTSSSISAPVHRSLHKRPFPALITHPRSAGSDPLLNSWTKGAEPLLPLPPSGNLTGWRDPFLVGRPGDGIHDKWTMLIGAGYQAGTHGAPSEHGVGAALVYESDSPTSGV